MVVAGGTRLRVWKMILVDVRMSCEKSVGMLERRNNQKLNKNRKTLFVFLTTNTKDVNKCDFRIKIINNW